jgi:hypothetical protein
MNVTISTEQARGCGYRKPGKDGVGIYLVSDGLSDPCGLLPYPLEICACCGGGIKQARGWTWITPELLFGKQDVMSALAGIERDCSRSKKRSKRLPTTGSRSKPTCPTCPVGTPPPGLHGLLWIGEAFYPTSDEFQREAGRQGVSRKLKAVPHGFVLGETWIYLAHSKAVRNPATGKRELPGIFSAFRPRQVDLVIDDEHNVPEKALNLAERLGEGARLVKVVRDIDAQLDLETMIAKRGELH